MQNYQGYAAPAQARWIAHVSEAEKVAFLRKVYLHVAGAVGLFLVLETALQAMPFAERIARDMSNVWLLVILGFWVVGWIANKWTRPGLPLAQQYLGLGLYTAAEAVIFMPLIAYVRLYQDSDVLPTAAMITLALAVGLSFIALDSRTEFSMLRGALAIGFPVALGLIIASILFGVGLGTWFSLLMIGLAAAAILYKTDQITRASRTDGYVSASLALFASFMLLLWYVIRLLSARR
jgi:FtsH-binding integral membrane protein